jgi:hypothetical protein
LNYYYLFSDYIHIKYGLNHEIPEVILEGQFWKVFRVVGLVFNQNNLGGYCDSPSLPTSESARKKTGVALPVI